ncbi:unnamed protein product [Caretta caretta]
MIPFCVLGAFLFSVSTNFLVQRSRLYPWMASLRKGCSVNIKCPHTNHDCHKAVTLWSCCNKKRLIFTLEKSLKAISS